MSTLNVLLDARSTSTLRISGWERYARSLSSILAPMPKVALSSQDARSFTGRLASDWINLPRHSRGFDLVHFPTFPPSPLIPATRSLTTIHDMTWWKYPETASALGKHYYRRFAERAARGGSLATVSNTVKNELLEAFPESKVFVIGNVVSIDQVTADDYALPPKPYFLAVGSIEPRKNLRRLANAYAASNLASEFDLLLVGRRAWGALPPGVRFTGPVSDSELVSIYKGAQAVIAPSLYEGFGLPVAEAMALGVPIHCSDIPVFREVAGERADFFDALDEGSITHSLLRAATLETSARPDRYNPFTEEACREQILNAYESIGAS